MSTDCQDCERLKLAEATAAARRDHLFTMKHRLAVELQRTATLRRALRRIAEYPSDDAAPLRSMARLAVADVGGASRDVSARTLRAGAGS